MKTTAEDKTASYTLGTLVGIKVKAQYVAPTSLNTVRGSFISETQVTAMLAKIGIVK